MNKDGLANFFLGLGVGVGIGLLFAPKSGEETRDLLMNKADEGKEFLKKQAADLRENAGGMATDFVDKGREALNRQKDTLNDAIQAGKQAYREKVETPDGISHPA
ncbi:MAG: YtxH domain-containing protein [Acidobacteriota bacterium]|nr:YtxH domain-containing protein [Acidobacteriota bacterium]